MAVSVVACFFSLKRLTRRQRVSLFFCEFFFSQLQLARARFGVASWWTENEAIAVSHMPPIIAEFYRVLLGFTGFYRVLPSFTEFYRVSLGVTEFYRVLELTSFTQRERTDFDWAFITNL